jgi:hemerythrin-like domain-containing protein
LTAIPLRFCAQCAGRIVIVQEAAIADHPTSSASAGKGDDAARALALGSELIEVHESLRQSLRRLRTGLGSSSSAPGKTGRSLRAHCLGFCSAVSRHHTSEDRGVFPALAAQVPELGPVLQELQRDHHLVAEILQRVEQIAGDFGQDNAHRVRAEMDGLAAILESHFRWEERRLVNALNSLDTSGLKTQDLFGQALPPG